MSPLLLVAPAGLIALLLVFATAEDGAFDLRYWAPLAILVLIMLLTMLIGGGLRFPRTRPLIGALAAIWGFTAWTLLSAAWAQSAANAWEGGGRTLLYAALFTVGLTALPDRRLRSWLGTGLVAAVSSIAVVTLFVLLSDGTGAFLAGRLNDPIGYRNGTAALFAFAVWPLIGVAAPRGGNPILRAAALAGAVLMLGLAFLTESRGVTAALVAGGVVFLAIGPDRLRRAWLALVAVTPVAIASGRLLRPYDAFDGGQGTVTGADVGAAAEVLVLIVLAAFAVGLAVAVFDNGLRSSPAVAGKLRRMGAVGLGAVLAAGMVAALIAIGNPVSYANERVDEFTNLETQTSEGSTRLGSVGGPRYDLWRVAWEEFKDEPVAGVGEGNYSFGYFRERETDRNLSDPHSLPFQLLSETGLIGSALFATFVVALGFAIAQRARGAPASERRWIASLAAAGTVLLAQTVADWLWLLPGVLGLAFLALALAAAEDPLQGAKDSSRAPAGRSIRAGRLLGSAVLLAAIASVAVLYLSDLYVRQAREASGSDPEEQLDSARTAERLNPVSVTPLYLQASALESQGDREGARDALAEALDQEPDNFVTLGLLGDLDFRAREYQAAEEYYRSALELNPRDVGLQRLIEESGKKADLGSNDTGKAGS